MPTSPPQRRPSPRRTSSKPSKRKAATQKSAGGAKPKRRRDGAGSDDMCAAEINAYQARAKADIIRRLGAELIEYKRGLGESREAQYGADRKFFARQRGIYGKWLTLEAIKSSAKRQRKAAEAGAITGAARAGPIAGPCSWINCTVPAAEAQLCQGCSTGLVHRQCIPHIMDAGEELLCPGCYQIDANQVFASDTQTNFENPSMEQRQKLARDHLAGQLKRARDECEGKQLKHGVYDKLHREALERYNLQETGFSIKKATMDRRMQRNRLTVSSLGPKPPTEHWDSSL